MKSIQTDGRDFYVPRSETSNARCYREKGARTTPEVSPGPASPAKARRGWRWKLQHHQVYEMTNVLRGRTLQNEYTDLPVRTVARPPQAEGQEQDPAPAVLVIPPNFRPHQPPEHKTRDSDYKSPGLCSPFPPSWLPQGSMRRLVGWRNPEQPVRACRLRGCRSTELYVFQERHRAVKAGRFKGCIFLFQLFGRQHLTRCEEHHLSGSFCI